MLIRAKCVCCIGGDEIIAQQEREVVFCLCWEHKDEM